MLRQVFFHISKLGHQIALCKGPSIQVWWHHLFQSAQDLNKQAQTATNGALMDVYTSHQLGPLGQEDMIDCLVAI